MDNLKALYSKPLPSSRSGAFYNTFPYPTKISPEAIAIYIACTTQPGDLVLDAFAGSGSAGVAALLCEHPTEYMKKTAKDLNLAPIWGARNVVLYEIGTYASFAIKTILSRLPASEFAHAVDCFIEKAQSLVKGLYEAADLSGNIGTIRYVIWSEVLICPNCNTEISYFEYGTSRNPVQFKKQIICPHCQKTYRVEDMPFAIEGYDDPLLHKKMFRKKRVPAWIYGTTNGCNWDRPVTQADIICTSQIEKSHDMDDIPQEIQWGELHRAGYHYGITHLHHSLSFWEMAAKIVVRSSPLIWAVSMFCSSK